MENEIIKNINGEYKNKTYYQMLGRQWVKMVQRSHEEANASATSNCSINNFNNRTSFYLNPTEELNLGAFITPGSRVLTVLSSGDFVLDAIYHGASEVVTFDVNKYQLPVAAAKLRMANTVSFSEFMQFFTKSISPRHLNSDFFNQVYENDKSYPAYAFLKILMARKKEEESALHNDFIYKKLLALQSRLLCGERLTIEDNWLLNACRGSQISADVIRYADDKVLNKIVWLLTGKTYPVFYESISGRAYDSITGAYNESDRSFAKTQANFEGASIWYANQDIRTVDKINQKDGYDAIYLSNIPDYLEHEEFCQLVTSKLMPLLTENGQLVYLCHSTDNSGLTKPITQEDEVNLCKARFFASFNHEAAISLRSYVYGRYNYHQLKEMYDVSLSEVKSVDEIIYGNTFNENKPYSLIRVRNKR